MPSPLFTVQAPQFNSTHRGEELFTSAYHRGIVEAFLRNTWGLIRSYNNSSLQKFALMFNVPCNSYNNTIASFSNLEDLPEHECIGDICPHNVNQLYLPDLLNLPDDSIIQVSDDNDWVYGPLGIRSYMGKRIGNVVLCFISPNTLHNDTAVLEQIIAKSFESFEKVIFSRSYSIRAGNLNGVSQRAICLNDGDGEDCEDGEDDTVVTCSFKRAKPI